MDDNDLTWPRREPEEWHGVDVTRDEARRLLDLILEEPAHASLSNALDEAQGDAEGGEAFLLVRIVDR